MRSMLQAGVPLMTLLTVVAQALNDRYLEERIPGMRSGIERGKAPSLTTTNSGICAADAPVRREIRRYRRVADGGCGLRRTRGGLRHRATEGSLVPVLTTVIGGLVPALATGIILTMQDLAAAALQRVARGPVKPLLEI